MYLHYGEWGKNGFVSHHVSYFITSDGTYQTDSGYEIDSYEVNRVFIEDGTYKVFCDLNTSPSSLIRRSLELMYESAQHRLNQFDVDMMESKRDV